MDITKYVELIYPQNPSQQTIQDGNFIEGRQGDLEQIQEFLKENINKEDVKKSVTNIQEVMKNAEAASKNLEQITAQVDDFLAKNRRNFDKIVFNTMATTKNANNITYTLREFSDKPEKENGLRSTLTNISETAKNINTISLDISCYTGNEKLYSELTSLPAELKKFMITSENTLRNLDQKACMTLDDLDRLINRADCMGAGLSNMLSQRLLVLRLLFGKPGKAFEICQTPCPPQYMPFNCCPCPVKKSFYNPYRLRHYIPSDSGKKQY